MSAANHMDAAYIHRIRFLIKQKPPGEDFLKPNSLRARKRQIDAVLQKLEWSGYKRRHPAQYHALRMDAKSDSPIIADFGQNKRKRRRKNKQAA